MDFHRIKQTLGQDTPAHPEWKGAVLFLCNEEFVFLIKRAESMPTHGGQIAFVGGHKKDGESPWDVAQREFEEETGLGREHLELLGHLPLTMTARNQQIVPVMARLTLSTSSFLREIRSNGEWDDVVAYPWKELEDEERWNFAWRHGQGKVPVMFHTIRSRTYLPLDKNERVHLLWGATAGMIWNFLRLYFK